MEVTSRPRLGSTSSDWPLSVLPTVAFMVCNSAPVLAVTSTVVAVEPTFSLPLSVSTWPIWTACAFTS